jgi:para-aminobenzoate synthetase component 1
MLYSAPLPYHSDASFYFASIRDLPWPGWLDSAGCGRYDILVAQPVFTLITQGAQTEINGAEGVRATEIDPFELLRQQLGAQVEPIADIPFAGGALGYWSYDLARRYHDIQSTAYDAEGLPEMAVGIYDWAIIIDHQESCTRLVSRLRYTETERQLPDILMRLESAAAATRTSASFKVSGNIGSNLSREDYANAFDQIKDYLQEGDCYQVNLAQRYSAKATGDAFAAYQQLRQLSPSPYSAYLDWPQTQILCASPERFLHVQEGRVETKPIKGTRPRSADTAEDVRLAQELRQHTKDRAENLMIVDLLRNDLSKSCEPGSVCVPQLFQIESYANVHHLVSTVHGKLRQGCGAIDVLRDCFPGGSITGAPKQRAMEIIEQLEPQRRGVYCGCIGYIGHDGNMDTNIAIRTLVYANGEIRGWAGGGIVADSQCAAEYQETLDKASAMLAVLRSFGGAET